VNGSVKIIIWKNVFLDFAQKNYKKAFISKNRMCCKPSKIKDFKRRLCKMHNFELQYQSLL